MSAAAAGEQGHIPSHRRVGAGHIQRVMMQGQPWMGFSQPLYWFIQYIFNTVNQLFNYSMLRWRRFDAASLLAEAVIA